MLSELKVLNTFLHSKLAVFLLLALFSLAACGQQQRATIDVLSSAPQNLDELAIQTRARTFDTILDTLGEFYLYADAEEVDLDALRTAYRNQALGAQDYSTFHETVREMLSFLPPGSVTLQTRDERIALEVNSNIPVGYQGIGAFIAFRSNPEPHVVLMAIMPGSPAEGAGLQARDSIYALDGIPFSAEETASDVAARVRGPAGTTITFTIQSPGEERRDVEVTRAPILATTNRLLANFYEDGNILHVAVPRSGYPDMSQDLVTMLEAFSEDEELGGIILDLRIATTGSGWPIADMLALFVEGEVGTSFTRTETLPFAVIAENQHDSQNIPLAILIGPDTQGLPELFAASVQTAGRGVVYGLPSPGNIEIFSSYALPDGSQLTVTTSSFVTIEGVDIGITGVTPDVPIDIYWETQPVDNDEVVNTALDALQGGGS